MSNLPAIREIYGDLAVAQKNDAFVALMNQPPKQEWIKEHPYIKGYKYIPIERIEYLLKSVFKRYRIEITGQGTSFNGVYVTVRIHYINPLTGDWDFHDGIGASQLQTAKGTSPADLANINNGALSMAFPIAKTLAVKDAADHFGKLFGSDLNRKDVIEYEVDVTLIYLDEKHPNWEKVLSVVRSKAFTPDAIREKYNMTDETYQHLNDLYNGKF